MEIIFRDKDLDRLETDPTFDGTFPSEIVSLFRRRMQYIRDAEDERDFYNMKSLRFEKLEGGRKHQHSMRLNDQWRLILEFEDKGHDKIVIVVSIEDYH